jgi:hypothetical protein
MNERDQLLFELDDVRRRYQRVRRRLVRRRLLLFLCAAFAVLVAADLLFNLPPIYRRLLVSAAALGAIGFSIFMYARHLRRPLDDARVALYVEERLGGFDEALVTAASIDPASVPEAERPLAQELSRRVLRKVRLTPLEGAVDQRAAFRAGLHALVAIFLVLLLASLMPGRAARALLPFGAAEAGPALNGVAAPEPLARDIEVDPKSLLVELGGDADVYVRATAPLAQTPVLIYTPAEGEPRGITMAQQSDAWTYKALLSGINADGVYRVVAGDIASPDYPVKTYLPPKIISVRHTVTLPDYLKLPPKEVAGGDVTALIGSRVQVSLKFNKPVVSCKVTSSWGPAPVLEARETEAEARFTVAESGQYTVLLPDADGYTNGKDGTVYKVVAQEDKPPTVTILEPGGDVELALDRELTIRVEASDDYGVADLGLFYNINGGEDVYVGMAQEKGDIPPERRIGQFTVSVESVGLKPGDVMIYFARADDANTLSGPGRTWTRRFFIFGMMPYQDVQGGPASGGSGGVSLTAAQRKIILATASLADQPEPTNTWDFDHRAVAKSEETLGETVTAIRNAAEADGDSAKAALGDQVLDLFREVRTALLEKRAYDALIPEQEALPLLYQLEPKLNVKGGAPAAGSGGSTEPQDQQTDQQPPEESNPQDPLFTEMKTVKVGDITLPEEMRQAPPPPPSGPPPLPGSQSVTAPANAPEVVEAVRRMEELARRQENMANQEGTDPEAAAREQQQMAGEMEQLADKLQHMAAQDRGNAPLSAAASKLSQAAGAMRAAGEAAGEGQQGMAAAKSRAAAQALADALASVSRTSSQSVRQRTRDAAAEARELAQRARDLEQARKDASTNGLQQTDTALNEYAAERLNEDVKQFRESLEQLGEAAKSLADTGATPPEYPQAIDRALSRFSDFQARPDANRAAQAEALDQAAALLEVAESDEAQGEQLVQAAEMVGELVVNLEGSSEHAFGAVGSARYNWAKPEEAGTALRGIMPVRVEAGTRALADLLAEKLESAGKLPPQEQSKLLEMEALPLAKELQSRLLAAARAAGRSTPTHSGFVDEYPPEYSDAVKDYFRALATEGEGPAR